MAEMFNLPGCMFLWRLLPDRKRPSPSFCQTQSPRKTKPFTRVPLQTEESHLLLALKLNSVRHRSLMSSHIRGLWAHNRSLGEHQIWAILSDTRSLQIHSSSNLFLWFLPEICFVTFADRLRGCLAASPLESPHADPFEI